MSTENNQLKPGDQRPKRGGWAPGNYFCRCNICEDMFTGDERAIWCADCAYAAPDEELVTPAPTRTSDAAREAARRSAGMSYDTATKVIQTAIDDSTASLRREVEGLKAERDKSSAMLASTGRVLNIAKDALALANKQRDTALAQLAEATKERDGARARVETLKIKLVSLSDVLPEWSTADWEYAEGTNPRLIAGEFTFGDALALRAAIDAAGGTEG